MSKARGLAALGNAYSDGALSNRNLIINGAMQVAQRGTSAVTPTASTSLYPVDRWGAYANPSSKYSAQQQTGGPNGFDKYVRITSLTAHTSSAADFFPFFTNLEGQDVQQFQYGSSGAKDVSLSFWVRSSLAGNFSVAFRAQGATVSCATTYTINAANIWEYKTVTVAGNTSTSIDNDNTTGFDINFDLGHGSSSETTANTWVAGSQNRIAGTTRLVETNGATLDITGVQLELGDTATPFENRSYGDELLKCERYYATNQPTSGKGNNNGTQAAWLVPFRVQMRTVPTVALRSLTYHCDEYWLASRTISSVSHLYGSGQQVQGVGVVCSVTCTAFSQIGLEPGALSLDAEL